MTTNFDAAIEELCETASIKKLPCVRITRRVYDGKWTASLSYSYYARKKDDVPIRVTADTPSLALLGLIEQVKALKS